MSNTQTVLFLLLVCYLVPLALMFGRRIWIRIYFAIGLAAVLFLAYETHVALQTEEDCRAGCALVISIFLLIITAVVGGFLLAALSAFGFKKCRALMASRSFRPPKAKPPSLTR